MLWGLSACPVLLPHLPASQLESWSTFMYGKGLEQLQHELDRHPDIWPLLGRACARAAALDASTLPQLTSAVRGFCEW